MACSFCSPEVIRASTSRRNSFSCEATAVLRAIMAQPQLAEEPTARNSKRLPVKAKGDVRLRSVLSTSTSGMCATPSCIRRFSSSTMACSLSAFSSWSSTAESWLPRKTLMMEGGASWAPRRWALVAVIMEAFRRALCFLTAIITLTRKVTKRRFSSGVLPGVRRPTPVSVPSDQLQCLPEPLTPAKGFSCNSTLNP